LYACLLENEKAISELSLSQPSISIVDYASQVCFLNSAKCMVNLVYCLMYMFERVFNYVFYAKYPKTSELKFVYILDEHRVTILIFKWMPKPLQLQRRIVLFSVSICLGAETLDPVFFICNSMSLNIALIYSVLLMTNCFQIYRRIQFIFVYYRMFNRN